MDFLSQWWRQPSRYDWIVRYLQSHNSYNAVRIVTITALIIGPAAPLLVLASPAGPDTTAGRVLTTVASLVGMSTAAFWLGRPMSQRMSSRFCVTLTIAMAVAAVSGTEPRLALGACAHYVMITAYAAIFHSARMLLFIYTLCLTAAAVLAVRIAADDPLVAIVGFFYVISIFIIVPVVLQWLVGMLHVDVANSDLDPLTELLNRRTVDNRVNELLGNSDLRHLVLVIIDLDKFKALNDSKGHAAGDRALAAVAAALRRSTRSTAVLARIGGEEFLVADVVEYPEYGVDIAERIRVVIPQAPPHLSASVGAVIAPVATIGAPLAGGELDRLIDIADAAMYDAKRAGGNQIRVRRWQP